MRVETSAWRELPTWCTHERHWFVLSDTHGRIEAFRLLLESKPDGAEVIHLGDIGDRGHDSVGVYRIIDEHPEFELIAGNHDLMTYQAMFAGASWHIQSRWLKIWKDNCGGQFHSEIRKDRRKQELVSRVLNRQKLYAFDGNLFFVHSGLFPEDDFGQFSLKRWIAKEDLIFEPVPHLTWRGTTERFWCATEQTEWKGFPVKPFFIHGHRACTRKSAIECTMSELPVINPREDSWRIGVDDRIGMTALEIHDHRYRFFTIDGCGFW